MKLAVFNIDDRPELVIAEGGKYWPVRALARALGQAEPVPLRHPLDPLRDALEAGLESLYGLHAKIDKAPAELALTTGQFCPPIRQPSKILAAGRNYHRPGHQVEKSGNGPPVFAKFPNTLLGHDQPVVYPQETERLDYEAELAVIIGHRCRDLTPDNALSAVAGYTILNDLTMSDVQRREIATGLILFSKNADGTGPCGPWMVTADEVSDPDNLAVSLTVNGQTRQADSTQSMVFSVAELVAYCSRISLEPGDIIATGTPSGTAAHSANPEKMFLRPGDVVEAQVEKIGTLRTPIMSP